MCQEGLGWAEPGEERPKLRIGSADFTKVAEHFQYYGPRQKPASQGRTSPRSFGGDRNREWQERDRDQNKGQDRMNGWNGRDRGQKQSQEPWGQDRQGRDWESNQDLPEFRADEETASLEFSPSSAKNGPSRSSGALDRVAGESEGSDFQEELRRLMGD